MSVSSRAQRWGAYLELGQPGIDGTWRKRLNLRPWSRVAAVTLLSAYFYVFMEWLFFATKPSFMSPLTLPQSLLVLAAAPGPLLVYLARPLVVCWLLGTVIRLPAYRSLAVALSYAIPAAVLGAAFFLLVDNFTITVLGWGIRHAGGEWLFRYRLLLVGATVAAYCQLWQADRALDRHRLDRPLGLLCAGLLCLTLAAIACTALSRSSPLLQAGPRAEGPLPNILLIVGDGLAANSMSAYGYERDTTPHLRRLAANMLWCENNFANAGPSGASIASMLTGKLPLRTRLIFPPDILTGADSYQHLPAILKAYRYRSASISLRHYVDAYDLNMRYSFDVSNDRALEDFVLPESLTGLIGQQTSYFLASVRDRIEGRLRHIWDIERMSDAFEQVRRLRPGYTGDETRVAQLWKFIDEGEDPFFVYIHLLVTHGNTFNPPRRVFSAGQEQVEAWMTDFYDDAVLAFDAQVQGLLEGLSERGKLANTVVVIASDHGIDHRTHQRLPLMFLFPGAEPRGRISTNTQNLDIAPTLLDYLGVSLPAWMQGQSLISAQLDAQRVIFNADRLAEGTTGRDGWLRFDGTSPPFYSLGFVALTRCDREYELDLEHNRLRIWTVEGHTRPCAPNDHLDPLQAHERLRRHLIENGYDASSLETPPEVLRMEHPDG